MYYKEHMLWQSQISYHKNIEYSNTAPRSIHFWKEKLDGCQPCLFPTLATKDETSQQWVHTSVDLPIARDQLSQFTLEHKVDEVSILQVAWALVLRDYVGIDDVCFGHRSAGRPIQGLGEAVGCFATSPMVCRISLPTNGTIISTLQAADERHQEAQSHQHVEINDIQHALSIKGRRFFNSCLSFKTMAMDTENLQSNTFRHVQSRISSEYDISVSIGIHAQVISLDIGQRILSHSQAQFVAYAFGRAIHTIIDYPNSLIKETDLFSEFDHQQILAWNSTSPDRCEQSIPDILAWHASENPDIQAVCAWDGELTFFELHKYSMALAGYLVTCGLGAQTPVPVIADKSRWAVVAMLAVLQ